MMSNIFNWLNPHKLEFSVMKTQAGKVFEIFLNPQTNILYTRAPHQEWEKHTVSGNPFRYQNTGRVGVYTISENGKKRYFTVNLTDESESEINFPAYRQQPDRTEGLSISEEISTRQPLWMLFIMMGCALLVIEWYSWLKIR